MWLWRSINWRPISCGFFFLLRIVFRLEGGFQLKIKIIIAQYNTGNITEKIHSNTQTNWDFYYRVKLYYLIKPTRLLYCNIIIGWENCNKKKKKNFYTLSNLGGRTVAIPSKLHDERFTKKKKPDVMAGRSLRRRNAALRRATQHSFL